MSTTAERVTEIVVDQLGVTESEVTPSAHFADDLGADSLDTIDIIMTVEEEFDVLIPDEDVERLMTVQALASYLDAYKR